MPCKPLNYHSHPPGIRLSCDLSCQAIDLVLRLLTLVAPFPLHGTHLTVQNLIWSAKIWNAFATEPETSPLSSISWMCKSNISFALVPPDLREDWDLRAGGVDVSILSGASPAPAYLLGSATGRSSILDGLLGVGYRQIGDQCPLVRG